MAFWNKKKKDEEESTQPSSSADSAPTSRAARAVRDLFNATVQGQQKAVQADQAVAQAGQKKLADAAQNLYAATVQGQQAATQANQAAAQAQSQRVQNAAQGIYSAYQQQQERAARQQMAQQQAQLQAPSQRAQNAAQGLYSAYLNQQQSGMPQIQAPTQRAAEAAQGLYSAGLKNIGTRRYNSAPEQRGNLSVNPADRGRVQNPDGSYSTVDTFSREEDGMEVLVPSVIKVNGQWKHVDEDTAWQHYLQTGENFGKFRTPEEADAYARQLHEYHENYYADKDEQDDGILANLFRQQAGELAAQENVRQGMTDSLKKAGSAVFNFVPNRLAANFNVSDEDQMRYQLQQAGYSDKRIDEMIASGFFDPTAYYKKAQDADFYGQMRANYTVGDLTQQADILIGQGIITGNQEFIDRGNELRQRAADYAALNEEAISHDSGTLGNMIAKDLAQYAPQAIYQQMAALPYQPIAALGEKGEAVAQMLGSGSLSYTTMAGSAYTNLIEQGVDPEKAVQMAKDEATVSAAIEMGDTFTDWAFGPAKDLNPFAGIGEKMARSLAGKLAVAVGKWALNVGQEAAEEGSQEIVSMANERRAADKNAKGGIWELLGYVMDEAKETAPELYDALKGEGVTDRAGRVIEAGKGGAVIAMFMGLLGEAGGAINKRANQYNAEVRQALDVIAANEDPQALRQMNDQELTQAIETAKNFENNAAAQVLQEELTRRDTERGEKTIPARTVVPYADNTTRNRMQSELHERMVEDGNVIDLTDSMQGMDEFYPDLRRMPKKERNPILRQKITELKDTLFKYLSSLRGIDFDFDINGTTLEARLYNTGIEEVMKNITREKAGMLSTSEQIFRSAEYLYSTEDKKGSQDVQAWDYFYVPVKIGDSVVGVRIAVRSLANRGTSEPAQIYNWGIKKDATLGGGGRLPNGSISTGASSDASVQSLNSSEINIPQAAENINSELSEQAPTARAQEAAQQMAQTERVPGLTLATESGTIDGKAYEAVDESTLTKSQRNIIEATQAIAEALGLDVTVVNARGDLGGAYMGGGKIYLNIASGMNLSNFSKAIGSASMSHELTHWMDEYAHDDFETLKRITIGSMSEEQLNTLVREQMAMQPGLTEPEALDEVVANACQPLLKDSKAFEQLARQDMSLAERILDFIKQFADRIRNAFADVDFNDNLPVFHAVQAVEDHIDEMQTAFDKALLSARENMAAQNAEPDATDAALRNSTPRFQMNGEVEATDQLVAVHNKSISGLRRMLRRGGIPFPSIAIKKAGSSHEGFGDVSIVFPRSTIDPQVNRQNRLYSNDAWTPTEPLTEYEVDIPYKLKNKIAEAVGEDIFSALNGYSYLDDGEVAKGLMNSQGDLFDALKGRSIVKYAYLKSIGQEPKAPGRAQRLDGFGKYKNEQLMAIFDALTPSEIENLSYNNGDDQRVADILNEQFRSQFQEGTSAFKALLSKPLYQADKVNLNAIKDAWRKYADNGYSILMEPDSQALDRTLRDNTEIENDPGFREWVEKTFGGVVKGSGIPNGKDPYTSSGNRRSFKQTHVPATLENIVAQMRKENEKGVGVMGVNLRGAATKTYNTVEEMRADSGKLLGTRISDDEYDSYMSEFHGRLHEMTRQASPSERWETQDSTEQILLETLRDAKSKEQMDRMLKKEARWINLYDGLTDQLWQLKQDVQDMPAPYFEAKPRRIVYPEEALAYILPDTAGQDIQNELKNRGFNVMLYKEGDEADRLQKLNSVPKARFQSWEGMMESGDIRRQLAEAEREYMEHSDANDAEYDYRAQLDRINELRRQVQEADSVNAEADNINAEADTNPAVESLEREGRVSRGAGYDAERYGDPNPERGQMGSDGVRTCNTTEDLEAELMDVGEAKYRNDTGEYAARIRAKSDSGYLLTINRDGKRDTSRSFGNMGEAAAYAASYIEGQTQARTDAELDAEKSAPVRRQEPIEALTTGQVQDEAKRQKQNKAAEASTQSLRDRIRKTDEEIKALRRLEKTTGLTETQAKHKADLQETLEILNDELTSRKGRAKAKKEKVEVKGNKPVRSAAEAKNKLMDLFHTAAGQRADTNRKLDAKLAEIVSSGKITEQNRQDILDMLIDAGMVQQEAEQEFRDVRDWLRGSRIYVSEHDRADFGDDWEGLRKSAWANGIYLTNNESDRSVDSLVGELAETFGTNMFPTDDAASDMLRNLIEQAGKGRSSMITFAEAVNNEARMEHVDPQEIWDDLSRQVDETLKTYAEKAKLEVDLKDRTASMLATERKRAEDRIERMAQRRREGEIREKTFKAIRRLKKLRGKAAADVKTQIDEAIRDIDTQARQLTINGLEDLQELARVYDDAKKAAGYVDAENPGNFISNPYIEEKLNRLTQKHINEMDIDDVIELGRVVSALENTVKTNGKMIGEAFDSEVKNVAEAVNAEVQSSKGAGVSGLKGFAQKWFKEEQLAPRRFLEMLGGWKKGAMAELADSLEKGQTRMLDFQRRAAQSMDPFMDKHKKWLKTASGKNAKWYTYSVANGMAMDGSGITGQTIEITPMMKVSLYLMSLNEDNLRHIQTGGLRIPNKALYLKGKTQEAFAQGQQVKMQPQAVRAIASTLTQEEKTFAQYLQKFFDTQSKDAINEVSLKLDGFERADVENYFPIESYSSYIKSDVSGEARAATVEGIGSIANERVHAGNPIKLDDAYDVWMRQVEKVSRYYGYAIPIRNFQAVNNYVFHEEGNAFAGSIKDTINRKWGTGAESYITKMLKDIQSGSQRNGDLMSSGMAKMRSNLAGATLTLNGKVAMTQAASYPGAAQTVGWDGLAAGLVSGPVNEKLIEKYTPLLWYRSQGYSTQEIGDAISAQNKTVAQKVLGIKLLNWIQGVDILTVRRLWKAAEYRVTKDTGLKPGSKELIDSGMDPYYQKVAEVFNRAVYDTQPNYTEMERAQILRSDSDVTKFFTMYKTVPLQYYGMMTEAVGRLQAAQKSGNKAEIATARRYAANTFAGLIVANAVYSAIGKAMKGFLYGKKDDEDEEGTANDLKQLGIDTAETFAGSVIGGAEAWSLIESAITGKKWNAPQMNILTAVEDIWTNMQSVFKAWDSEDPQKIAKAVRETAKNVSAAMGIPLKNMENLILAITRWRSPEAAMQYDAMFGGIDKGSLKTMDPGIIGSATSLIMNNRTGVNIDRDATNELSRLYAAGFTEAIPTAMKDSFEYGGNEVKIKDKRKYSETWGGVVGDSLEELTASDSYINADDKTKTDMIRKLYQYATVQARMGADPEYSAEGSSTYGWTEKADDAMESGMDLPTVIAAMSTMNAMTSDKVNGQVVKSLKSKRVEYIDGLKLDNEQKDALYEMMGYSSGLEQAPWHSGISAEAGYTTGTPKPAINEAARKRAVEANYKQLTESAAYKAADDLTKKAMIEKLNQYAEVQGRVTTDPNYLPTGSEGWTIWAEAAEKAGIDLISAIDYATQLDSFKADYNEYGKAISGSKKEKVEKYINGLDLTNDQKDVLYLKLYTDSSLKYTPWHGGKKKKRRGGRRGSGKKSAATKKPVSVGKITPKYDTGLDISKLFGTTGTKSGKSSGLATDLAEIVNGGLDISELFKYTPTQKAPKGRTSVDFKL